MSLKISSIGILNITTTPGAIAGVNRGGGEAAFDLYLITQDNRRIDTEDGRDIIVRIQTVFLNTEDNRILLTESGLNIISYPLI
jgi:hypothetical protein